MKPFTSSARATGFAILSAVPAIGSIVTLAVVLAWVAVERSGPGSSASDAGSGAPTAAVAAHFVPSGLNGRYPDLVIVVGDPQRANEIREQVAAETGLRIALRLPNRETRVVATGFAPGIISPEGIAQVISDHPDIFQAKGAAVALVE